MLRIVAIPALFALALVTLIPREDEPTLVDIDQAAAARVKTSAAAGNGFAEATLSRAADGHFYADAQVNGATVRFLVDSGASAVVLTRADAQRAGVPAGPGDFTAVAQGAGGDVRLKPVMLDRVAIGPVAARSVQGAVAEDDLHVSLLGQSFLARVGTVAIAGDRMVLR